MFKAEIVADSRSPYGERLTSFQVTFPRIILAEINTHRMFSRSTSSSRAIPFPKMVEAIKENPFIPIAWQKPHKGMQGTEYYDHTLTEEVGGLDYTNLPRRWLRARDTAVSMAEIMADERGNMPVTKQLANRLLEPFMWTTMLITTGEEGLQNFFELRCPQYHYDLEDIYFHSKKDWLAYYKLNCIGNPDSDFDLDEMDWYNINKSQAEIHIQKLAELMYDAYNESKPEQLYAGQWHIPYADKINTEKLMETTKDEMFPNLSELHESIDLQRIKIATALAARVSYTSVGDDKELDYPKLVDLHDRLIDMRHDSPLEHCARVMSEKEHNTMLKGRITIENWEDREDEELLEIDEPLYSVKGWAANFKGFIPYRYLIENE